VAIRAANGDWYSVRLDMEVPGGGGGGGGAGRQAGMQARARGTLMWGHVSVGGGGGGGGQLAGSHLVADGDLLAAAATLPARRADPARRVPAGAMLLRHEKSGKVFAIETEGLSQVGRAGSRQPPAAQGGGLVRQLLASAQGIMPHAPSQTHPPGLQVQLVLSLSLSLSLFA
jgi:hypothetical protein